MITRNSSKKRANRVAPLFLMAGLCWLAMPAGMLSGIPSDSNIAWPWQQDGNIVPSIDGSSPWTEVHGDIHSDGRALKMSAGSYFSAAADRTNTWNGSRDCMVEVRLRVIDQNGKYATGIYTGSDAGRATLMLSRAGAEFRESGDPKLVEVDNSVFHTYRILIRERGTRVTVYIDGVLASIYTRPEQVTGANKLSIGNFSGETKGETEVLYIRWANEAVEPQPQ